MPQYSFLHLVIYSRSYEVKLLWKLYRLRSVIFLFWMGSRDQVRMGLKFLYCENCSTGLLKAQNRNCTIASVGSSIAALIAITSQLLPFTNQVHWLCRAFWTFSVLSAFLSAAFACKHTRFINNILLESDRDPWQIKKWFQKDNNPCKPAHPPLSVVLLLSGTKMFFDSAVISYVIGLAIYLGFVWQQNLDKDTSQDDCRKIFIVFLVSVFFCFCTYSLLEISPHPCESAEWETFLDRTDIPLNTCVMRDVPKKGVICVEPTPHSHPNPNRNEQPQEQV
ncbi:hypothetical protein N431DRAFT_559976 [Stipitochalara longipes BDJ]|nr:hypothetical protein N431DRAFT_559976 [Stipitochalara longipes BDJ]